MQELLHNPQLRIRAWDGTTKERINNMVTDAQKAVLGTIMLDSRRVVKVCMEMGVEDNWFDPAIRPYYLKALDLFMRGKIVDLRTIDEVVDAYNELLNSCIDIASTSSHAEYFIQELEKEHLKSEAKFAAIRQQDELEREGVDIHSFLAKTRQDWADLGNSEGDQEESLLTVGERVIERWTSPLDATGIVSWPLEQLRTNIGRITDEVIYLAASESTGKTALALQMLLYNGKNGVEGSMASLESSVDRVLPRLIAQHANLNTWSLNQGRGTAGEIQAAKDAIKYLDSLPMHLTNQSMDMDQLALWATVQANNGSKFLIIDNMKHIRSRHASGTIERFMELSMRLKWLRDDIGIPIVILHHLNDQGDVSWSKDIKRDADILLYMTINEERTIKPSQENDFIGMWVNDIEVRKNRDADAGYCLPVNFVKQFQFFKDME